VWEVDEFGMKLDLFRSFFYLPQTTPDFQARGSKRLNGMEMSIKENSLISSPNMVTTFIACFTSNCCH
jgi:hypothetical protein